ncbi:hypothetical protein Tco_1124250 [Tanacetum coccineum]|uniref:Uncharacterized protein n=1 Tax=Tanacetum coccineum TaxID=301880 RepID=A0ABQ5J7C2_9ASTR
MWETKFYEGHKDHKNMYEALEKSMDHDHSDQLLTDLAEARKKKKRRHESPKAPPVCPPHQPPLLHHLQSDQSKGTAAPSSSKTAPLAEYTAWTTIDTRLRPSVSSTPDDLNIDDDSVPDEQVHSSDDEDIGNDHIPKSIPSSDLPVLTHNWASALASTYAPPPENSLLAQTDDMETFMDWYCKKQRITKLTQKDLEGLAFEIVKVFHPDVIHLQYQMEECHKLLTDQVDDAILKYNVSKPLPLGGLQGQVTIQSDFSSTKIWSISDMVARMWIEEECKYDIAAMYGISHWWFQRQRFYIDRHTSDCDHRAHDFTVINSPRAVTFRDKYGVQMIMRFNEIHKFSDGTLQQIDEALDYRVKEFKVNRMNPGLDTRFWTRKDVERSKEFMFAIQKWLKTRRIFRNLESFVGGRVREGDYRLLQRTE